MAELGPETKPDCICALEELADKTILPEGWVMVKRNCDGLDGVGIKYLGGTDPLADLATLRARLEGLQQDVIGIVAMYQMTVGMHPRVRQAIEEACARSTAPDDSGIAEDGCKSR